MSGNYDTLCLLSQLEKMQKEEQLLKELQELQITQ